MGLPNLWISRLKFLLIRVVLPAGIKQLFSLYPRRERTLLVIKNDGAGDYILFRNYLGFLRNSEKYGNYRIYLLANPAIRDLAIQLDSDIIAGFYWYADSYFLQWRLIRLLTSLNRLRPEVVFYANYSRKYPVDWLVKNIGGGKKIAVDGDCTNESRVLKAKSDAYYTDLLPPGSGPLHEFERNRSIIKALTGEPCGLPGPSIDPKFLNISHENQVVIFYGASTEDKKWPASSFNRLCRLIALNLDTDIILVGGRNDEDKLPVIVAGIDPCRISSRDVDLTGLYTLISSARLLISGDTVAVHMAAALGTPAVCISKGDLFGRFVPYPQDGAAVRTVLPEGYTGGAEDYALYTSFLTSDITVERVYREVEKILLPKFENNEAT